MGGKQRVSHKTIEGIEHKQCFWCKAWFPLKRFCKKKNRWDGLNSRCNLCINKGKKPRAKCLVDWCQDLACRNGYCNKHGIQIKRRGKIMDGPEMIIPDLGNEAWIRIHRSSMGIYKVSNYGRVKSCIYNRERLLTPCFSKSGGYMNITCGTGKCSKLSSIIAKNFVPNPYNETRIIHKDGNKRNCRADNLEWYGNYLREESLNSLKKQFDPKAKEIVAFMEGEKTALDKILNTQAKRLYRSIGYWIRSYNSKGYVDVGDVVQDSLIKATLGIEKGLLRNTDRLSGWFSLIAKNTLINAIKKTSKNISSVGVNSYNEEYDLVDKEMYHEYLENELHQQKGRFS